MKHLGFLLQLFLFAMVFGCTSMSDTAKSRLTNGYYVSKNPQGIKEPRYVYYKNDTIRIYSVSKADSKTIDTTQTSVLIFPAESKNISENFSFSKRALSLNFQTIVFKYRPATANIPKQLSTEFNFNIYLGHRTDIYRIRYQSNPLGLNQRKFDRLAFSYGFFTGFGETPMSGSVTQNKIAYVYDGLVWLNGVGGIIGTKSFTLGAGVGMDQLLDRNHDIWIYQRKPWLGFLLGIKLR